MLLKLGNNIIQPTFKMVGPKLIELCEDYEFYYDGNLIIIESGYRYDGATIPKFLWGVLGVCPIGWVNPAALKHDYIYVNEGVLPDNINISRKWADKEFVNDLLELNLINNNFSYLYKFILRIAGLYYWKQFY